MAASGSGSGAGHSASRQDTAVLLKSVAGTATTPAHMEIDSGTKSRILSSFDEANKRVAARRGDANFEMVPTFLASTGPSRKGKSTRSCMMTQQSVLEEAAKKAEQIMTAKHEGGCTLALFDEKVPEAAAFAVKGGAFAETKGIHCTIEPVVFHIVVPAAEGAPDNAEDAALPKAPEQYMALYFVDTQGLFDEDTSPAGNVVLAAATHLMSQCIIHSCSGNLGEDQIKFLAEACTTAREVAAKDAEVETLLAKALSGNIDEHTARQTVEALNKAARSCIGSTICAVIDSAGCEADRPLLKQPSGLTERGSQPDPPALDTAALRDSNVQSTQGLQPGGTIDLVASNNRMLLTLAQRSLSAHHLVHPGPNVTLAGFAAKPEMKYLTEAYEICFIDMFAAALAAAADAAHLRAAQPTLLQAGVTRPAGAGAAQDAGGDQSQHSVSHMEADMAALQERMNVLRGDSSLLFESGMTPQQLSAALHAGIKQHGLFLFGQYVHAVVVGDGKFQPDSALLVGVLTGAKEQVATHLDAVQQIMASQAIPDGENERWQSVIDDAKADLKNLCDSLLKALLPDAIGSSVQDVLLSAATEQEDAVEIDDNAARKLLQAVLAKLREDFPSVIVLRDADYWYERSWSPVWQNVRVVRKVHRTDGLDGLLALRSARLLHRNLVVAWTDIASAHLVAVAQAATLAFGAALAVVYGVLFSPVQAVVGFAAAVHSWFSS